MSENHQVDKYFHNDTANRYIFEGTYRPNELDPERALLLAIFQDAIDKKDIEWINRPGYDPYGFSFLFVCEHLGFDTDWIRSGVLRRLGQCPALSSGSIPGSSVDRV